MDQALVQELEQELEQELVQEQALAQQALAQELVVVQEQEQELVQELVQELEQALVQQEQVRMQEQERPLTRQGSWVAAPTPQSEATAHATWMPVVKPPRSMQEWVAAAAQRTSCPTMRLAAASPTPAPTSRSLTWARGITAASPMAPATASCSASESPSAFRATSSTSSVTVGPMCTQTDTHTSIRRNAPTASS